MSITNELKEPNPHTYTLFTASWCSGCKTVKAYLEAKAIRYQTVDMDDNMQEFALFNIKSIPVLIKFENGVEQSRLIGSQPDKLKAFLDE